MSRFPRRCTDTSSTPRPPPPLPAAAALALQNQTSCEHFANPQVAALAFGGPARGAEGQEGSPELRRFAGLLEQVMSKGNAYAGRWRERCCRPISFVRLPRC